MYCKKCGIQNEADALFCKRCGSSLIEEYKNEIDKKIKKEKKKTPKQKVKTKAKVKYKVKKVKEKTKNKKSKDKVVVVKKMSFFSKVVMFLLIFMILFLLFVCGVLGYQLYTNENIEVPNIVEMTYDEAKSTLSNKKLNIERSDKVVDDESQVGIILEQSKNPGDKVSKNTVIKVVVGVLDSYISIPDVVGMNLDEAKNVLNHQSISFTISYQEVEDGEVNIVLKQNPKKNTKIERKEKVELVVSKKHEDELTNTEDDDIEEKEE